MEPSNPSAPVLGNRYQLLQTLGTGGMSVVYRARDLMLERPVAIKLLRQDYSSDEAFRDRFRLEAKAAANLSHPNIVTVHDFGLDTARLFIVMEYVPGTDLKTILKQRHILPVDETLQLMIQACAGIGYAHRAGLVHCDVKPHNMLVSTDMRLKVTDFGIARALASIHPDEQSDVVWGSPLYFSPEQAAGLAPSPASDVYSLGVILYEMLTGRLPFTSNDPTELARMHRDVNPIPPSRINPQIPPALEQVIMKVLSKEPSQRYRTADQLGRVLYMLSQQLYTGQPMGANLPPAQPVPVQAPVSIQPAASERPEDHGSHMPEAPEIVQVAKQSSESDVNWKLVGLGLAALIAVGGLFPFWLYIILTLFPPTP